MSVLVEAAADRPADVAGQQAWSCSWSMAGVWLVRTGPTLAEQISFREEDEAKARLIAAAPDLLAALKAAQHALITTENLRATDLTPEIFDAHLGNDVPRDQIEWMIEHGPALELADAAIAKAGVQ